jgi:hypothetical protein
VADTEDGACSREPAAIVRRSREEAARQGGCRTGNPPRPWSGGRRACGCGSHSREPEGGGRTGEAPPHVRQGDLPGEPQGRRSALLAAARDRDLTGGAAGKLGLRSGDRWGGSTERWPAGMQWQRRTLFTGARLELDSGLTARDESEWGKFLVGPAGQ